MPGETCNKFASGGSLAAINHRAALAHTLGVHNKNQHAAAAAGGAAGTSLCWRAKPKANVGCRLRARVRPVA